MKLHNLLHEKYKDWKELETRIESLPTTKEKGDAFEDFVYLFLEVKKDFYQIEKHWRYQDAPIALKVKLEMEKNDKGADGLIKFKDGNVAAYQAKFRTNRVPPAYSELTKLWAEAKKCDYQYTVANCYSLTTLAKKNPKHLQILCDEFENLGKDFFIKIKEIAVSGQVKKTFYKADAFQLEIIKDVVSGFKKTDRGKLIAACGTGKTLTSLWITENIEASTVLFVAPSIALIKQTLEAWSEQAKSPFDYMCICSDRTVTDDVFDESDLSLDELGIPVSTKENDILKNFKRKKEGKFYVFSTYQSLDLVSQAATKLGIQFDLGIFDEAHRTAGTNNSGHFSLGLSDQKINISKRLFMTATERLVRPRIIKKAEQLNRTVFSMDDEKIYGENFYRYSFGDAIKQGTISDYKIVVAGMTDTEIYQWVEDNDLIVSDDESVDYRYNNAENIFKQILLIKALRNYSISKCITFHNTVKQAREFIDGYGSTTFSLRFAFEKLWKGYNKDNVCLDHINGSMPSGDRHQALDLFANSSIGVVSNAKCLTEGVDVPIIDSVYFVTPKNSLIDIVQACGRALRKPRDSSSKIAYFIVPILIREGQTMEDAFNSDDFEMVHNLIQSLRDQDSRLEQWIDQINLNTAKGLPPKGGDDGPLILDLPKEFNVKDFELNLYTKIADVNGDPTKYATEKPQHKRLARKSGITRVFRTLGDYSVESYRKNLIVPTIGKFTSDDDAFVNSEMKINNNNVSHTERLGLIAKTSPDSLYRLTNLGKLFKNSEISFDSLFKQQMIKFFEHKKNDSTFIFPYRAMMKLLCKLGKLDYHDYIFCIYTLQSTSLESLNNAKNRIVSLRSDYPNIKSLNSINKTSVLKQLNEQFEVNLREKDVWEKRTTTYNQWIYMRNHLCLNAEYIYYDTDGESLNLNQEKSNDLIKLLIKTEPSGSQLELDKLLHRYRSPLIDFVKFSP